MAVILALGDICGKGLAAGMWTTHLVGLVGARVAVTSEPEAIVAGVNRDICLHEIDFAPRQLVSRKTRSGNRIVSLIAAPDILLHCFCAPMENWNCCPRVECCWAWLPRRHTSEDACELGPGDVLMIYSDGITESQNCAGEEFGDARLEAQLRLAQSGGANAMLFSMLGAVQDFAAASPTRR